MESNFIYHLVMYNFNEQILKGPSVTTKGQFLKILNSHI